MRISDWSSDVCSSDLVGNGQTLSQIANTLRPAGVGLNQMMVALLRANASAFINGNIHQLKRGAILRIPGSDELAALSASDAAAIVREQTEAWQSGREPQLQPIDSRSARSEEHTSELQSLMRISYAVFCLKKKKKI